MSYDYPGMVDLSKFEPLVEQYRKLIDQDIQRETRQLRRRNL